MKRPKIPDFVSRPAVDPKGIAYVYCARASSRRRKILWSRMPALDRTADTPCLGSVVPKSRPCASLCMVRAARGRAAATEETLMPITFTRDEQSSQTCFVATLDGERLGRILRYHPLSRIRRSRSTVKPFWAAYPDGGERKDGFLTRIDAAEWLQRQKVINT